MGVAEAGGTFSSAEHSSFGPGLVPRGKINSGERLFSVGPHVMGVCTHRVCGGGLVVHPLGLVCVLVVFPWQFVTHVVALDEVFGEHAHM